MKHPTALLIPSPWSGDERDPIPRLYWAWFALYRTTRIIRHRFGAHDWDFVYADPIHTTEKVLQFGFHRCSWCGAVNHDFHCKGGCGMKMELPNMICGGCAMFKHTWFDRIATWFDRIMMRIGR